MEQWQTILAPGGENTIRGTKYDSNVIGLLVDEDHRGFIIDGGFDGCYTYFVVDGFEPSGLAFTHAVYMLVTFEDLNDPGSVVCVQILNCIDRLRP